MTSNEIAKTAGALAIRPDQTEWTPAQQAVLQQSGISNEVTAAELSGFLHLCQRTQLDPFSRQIYLIGRWDGRSKRTVFTPQTGIDGYRVIAHRVVAESKEHFGYEDTVWCDSEGHWRDVWLSSEPPAAAKVTVLRNGQRFSAVAVFREYVQTNKEGRPIGLWGKMPGGQVAKCAEALALRKAFPHDLAGVYTAEEMAQADNPAPQAIGQPSQRHLRQVQPAEADPWATPEPQPQTAAQGRDYLHEAYQAADAAAVRQIWMEAKADGAVPAYLEQIAQVGRDKKAAAEAAPTAQTEDDIPDAEIVPDEPQPEPETALETLRKVARQAGLTEADLEEGFQTSYNGVPTSEATDRDLRDMTAVLRKGMAA